MVRGEPNHTRWMQGCSQVTFALAKKEGETLIWAQGRCQGDFVSKPDEKKKLGRCQGALASKLLVLQVYVGDIIFGSKDDKLCEEITFLMSKEFELSIIGELISSLGLKLSNLMMGSSLINPSMS